MFCKNCGTQLDDDAKFCEKCGTAIEKAEVTEAAEAPVEAAENEEVAGEVVVEPAEAFTETTPKKKKPIKLILALVAIVVVAVAAIVLVSGINKKKNAAEVREEQNFNNGALFACDDDRLYFVAKANEDDEDTCLYSTDYKGINQEIISEKSDIIRIRIVDKKIYYVESGDDIYTLGVMNLNGKKDKTITTSEELISRYDVYGGKMYYLADSQLHKCDMKGKDDTVLLEEVDAFVINKKTMYYASEGVISAFDLKEEKSTELCKAEEARSLLVDGKNLYFKGEDGLCKVAVNGKDAAELVVKDSELDYYIFADDTIYYNHQYTTDEIADIAESVAESSKQVLTYKLALIGCGDIYKVDKDGGKGVECETDRVFANALYVYPDGVYCKPSVFSSVLEKVEFEN